jgi:DNA repair exonuclease SbcCD ATPase subunit
MNDCLKQRASTLRNELGEIKHNIQIGESKIEGQEEAMKRLEENREEMIAKFTADINEHETKNIEYLTNIRADMENVKTCMNLISDEDAVRNSLQSMLSDEKDFENERRKFIKELEFYDKNDECPTCKQDIESDHKDHIVVDRSSNIKGLDLVLTQQSDSIQQINVRLEEINLVHKEINETQRAIQKEQNLIDSNEQYMKKVQSQIKDLEEQEHTVGDKEQLDKYKKALNTLQDMESNLVDKRHYYDLAEILLRDGGIKTKIVRQYLPIMNKLINKYLASMEFFVQFELDEEFNEEIKSRYRDNFTYSSFSEGEKMRIDLSLLFTWRSIAKLKNSVNTNLLILDEVFDSSLDEGGTDEFLKILQTLDNNTNTFIISHKGESMNEKFNNIIEFEKVNNFSRIK